MLTISKLFGRSPFAPLQAHMEKVADCVAKMAEIFDLLISGDHTKIEAAAREISKLEHKADLTKNDIRERLPKTLFLPVDRGNLLEILTIQDSIADKCEDIAMLLTLRKLTLADELHDKFKEFLRINIEAFDRAHQIIMELPELLESSFGGNEAEKVRNMVEDVAYKEHEADLLQRDLLKILFSDDNQLSYQAFQLWLHVFEELGAISNLAENLAFRVRRTLELK